MRTVVNSMDKIMKGMTAALLAAILLIFAADQSYAAKSNQASFKSPEEAINKMMTAIRSGEDRQLAAVFGPRSKSLFPAEEEDNIHTRESFIKAYEEKSRLERVNARKVILHIGNNDWPWPVPLVKTGKKWRFDTAAGINEMNARRIGKNEVAAVQVSLAYVDAQLEYARAARSQGLPKYAQKFMSDAGKKDGLCWESKDGEKPSPLGPLAAGACKTEIADDKEAVAAPYHGYFYRILKRQGADAPGGAYEYVVDGKMIGGFALVAYPAEYGVTGITTFIVNHQGVVYQKDLGKNTEKIAEAMTDFNPDPTWMKVD